MILITLLIYADQIGFTSYADVARLPQENCSWGFTLGDYDADGDPDVYMHSHIQGLAEQKGILVRSHLLRNEGGMQFRDVTTSSGMDSYNQDPHHASFTDFDNDGDLDLYVQMGTPKAHGTCYSELWEQQADGRFLDVATTRDARGIGFRGRGATWADIDLDGDLDVYGPGPLASETGNKVGRGSLLFRNDGPGPFAEIGEQAGVGRYDVGGYQAAFGDFDGDMLPDLVATWPLAVYRNLGGGHFEELGPESGFPIGADARSAIWEDFDQDGDLDLLVTVNNTDDSPAGAQPGLLLLRNDGGHFEDITAALGLDVDVVARGATFGDVDNDGDLDLFVSEMTRYRPDRLFLQGPDGRFTDEAVTLGLGATHAPGRSDAAFADFDGDGRLDLLVAQGAGGCYQNHGAPDIFHNDLAGTGHYLEVALQGTTSNRDALGAVVTLTAGEAQWSRHHLGPQHYLSQDRLPLHFGLGAHQQLDSLVVRWPSGRTESFTVEGVDRRVKLVEGQGREVPPTPGEVR